MQGVIEPSLFGFDSTIFHLPLDEYMAKVMETYLEAFARILQTDKNVIAVNYNEGMFPVMQKIAAFTGFTMSEKIMEQMKERAGYHAKFPGKVFDEAPVEGAVPPYMERAFELYVELTAVSR